MGEAAPCLVRSLSQPSDSFTQLREVDPLRALTTSISFGRYVSDSSSWEKYSCFSNNRYLEEAERISKPGSVAEKKALLEAHFKKISSNRANKRTNDHELGSDSLMVLESSETASQEVSDEMQEKEEANVLDAVERKELDMDKMDNMETETKTADIKEKVIPCAVPKPPASKAEHTKCASSKQEKISITDHTNKGSLVSTNKKKQALDIRPSQLHSSIKLSRSEPSKEVNTAQITKNTKTGSSEKRRSTHRSLYMSVNYSSSFGENSKRSTPMIQKTGDPKGVGNFSKISRGISTSHQNPTRASVAGTLVQPSATIQLQKRAKTCAKNTQSPTVASTPFSLRCEGRVAKRKEYFQKLEEKQKAKEAEKAHIQAKSKIVSTQSQTPKLGKQLNFSKVLDNGSRPLWGQPKINDATKGKEKSIRTPIRSSCTMSRKNIKENASPNIQHWL